MTVEGSRDSKMVIQQYQNQSHPVCHKFWWDLLTLIIIAIRYELNNFESSVEVYALEFAIERAL